MNLEVLFVSEKLTGNKTLGEIARRHVDTTIGNHIRPDGSTWHVVEYNTETGNIVSKYTAQGYSSDSTWSRGQAWAVYGFSNMYKRMQRPQYLTIACKLATYFHSNLPSDGIVPWDFNTPIQDPKVPGGVRPADSSAATIVTNGLLLLASLDSEGREKSISTPFSPPLPSPLSASFPASASAPEPFNNNEQKPQRRHGRMHSRNLSIFFPRPGSLPQSTIAEDGSQELEIPNDEESAMHSADSLPSRRRRVESAHAPTNGSITPLGAGFTFGARPPGSAPIPPPMNAGGSNSGSRSRRGHHHKHSLSHNFFSFLEPGSTQTQTPGSELHTQPTPVPVSPWNPISPFPTTPHTPPTPYYRTGEKEKGDGGSEVEEERENVPGASAFCFAQFILGASLWVSGQQNGSLSATGLGYWVVYDAFGIGVERVLPGYLSRQKQTGTKRRYYGDARIETVMQFAQSVYLMFAAVYICKETVEHVLLSAGSSSSGVGEHEGHHHHHADVLGINFPILLILLSSMTMAVSAFIYGTHRKTVELTGLRIPQLSPQSDIWSNPYITAPLGFALCLVGITVLVPSTHHIAIDLFLASIATIITFKLAYRASVVLGTVLLQTSPSRTTGGNNGKMETVLRVMREIERDDRVLHLPAPHIWVLTPGEKGKVVVTMEVHVSKDMADEEVAKLVRWVGDKVGWAVGTGNGGGGGQVTVGVVRG
uniref:Cation efflux protein transmembrane domain-containing protein n=1 Tax=Moniliophthora roreri TaxID=221103 RepID=A0A0W0F0L4_MONRR